MLSSRACGLSAIACHDWLLDGATRSNSLINYSNHFGKIRRWEGNYHIFHAVIPWKSSSSNSLCATFVTFQFLLDFEHIHIQVIIWSKPNKGEQRRSPCTLWPICTKETQNPGISIRVSHFHQKPYLPNAILSPCRPVESINLIFSCMFMGPYTYVTVIYVRTI